LIYSLSLNALAGIASCLSPNINWLVFFRIIGGIGIGGSVPVVFGLGAEIFPSSIRGKYLSLIASFWMVGAIYTAFTAWIMLGNDFEGKKIITNSHWRHFAAVSVLPAILALILTILIIPESPRYLLGKHKYNDAAKVLKYLTGFEVNVDSLKPNLLTTKNDTTIQNSNNININNQSINNYLKSKLFDTTVLKTLFSNKLSTSTILLMSIWFSISFGSYGISTWISTLFNDIGVTNAYAAAFIFALANLPGNIFATVFIEIYGRKNLLIFGMFFCSLSTLLFAFDTKNTILVIFSATLFNAFSVVSWNALDCISIETFPTNIRTSAMGFLASLGKLGAMSAQFVNGNLEKNIPLLLIVTSTCVLSGAFFSFLLPNESNLIGTFLIENESNSNYNLNLNLDGNSTSSFDLELNATTSSTSSHLMVIKENKKKKIEKDMIENLNNIENLKKNENEVVLAHNVI
jgi:MFS family permease